MHMLHGISAQQNCMPVGLSTDQNVGQHIMLSSGKSLVFKERTGLLYGWPCAFMPMRKSALALVTCYLRQSTQSSHLGRCRQYASGCRNKDKGMSAGGAAVVCTLREHAMLTHCVRTAYNMQSKLPV